MARPHRAPRPLSSLAVPVGYRWFEAAVLALLTADALIYTLSDSASKALDALAWLALLVLFRIEIAAPSFLAARHARGVLRALRAAAGVAVVAAALAYVATGETLDAINSGLWIGVVVLLEFEVRRLDAVSRHRTAFTAVAFSLYSALGVLVLIWAWRGEWFDAYDALLWLIAFATLEAGLLESVPT